MPGLAAVAAAFATAQAASHHFDVPIAILDSGSIHYDIRAVNDSTGLGGDPAACASTEQDYVMVTYMVTNRGNHDVPAIAVPRVVLIDQTGQVHQRDLYLSTLVEKRANPTLALRAGKLPAGAYAVQADVFITARNATRFFPWKLRPAPDATQAYILPQTKVVLTPECPRSTPPIYIEQ